MAFSTILDYTGNMQLRAYTKSDHKLDTLKQGLPDPHFYCTVVINCHVSVNGDKFLSFVLCGLKHILWGKIGAFVMEIAMEKFFWW